MPNSLLFLGHLWPFNMPIWNYNLMVLIDIALVLKEYFSLYELYLLIQRRQLYLQSFCLLLKHIFTKYFLYIINV